MNAAMYILLPNPATTDAPMTAGKAASQAAHAAVQAYMLTDPESKLYHDWQLGGHYTKIVLMTDNLLNAKMYLDERGIDCALILDEGRTEFEADLTPTAIGCALVNRDNPHISETFSAFKLLREPPVRPDPDPVKLPSKRPLRCRLGFHGYRVASSDDDKLEWCVDCGATWEHRYDGFSPFTERRKHMLWGRPRPDSGRK